MTGQRKAIKIFGAIEIFQPRFHYRRELVFNAETYLCFLERLAQTYYPRKIHLIQDNASYHKDGDVWGWFRENRNWIEVHQLPPYAPEFNATERLWHHTRLQGTHNRYFATEDDLYGTLVKVFRKMQNQPEHIKGYLAPFC